MKEEGKKIKEFLESTNNGVINWRKLMKRTIGWNRVKMIKSKIFIWNESEETFQNFEQNHWKGERQEKRTHKVWFPSGSKFYKKKQRKWKDESDQRNEWLKFSLWE